MNDKIQCPSCAHQFDVEEALSTQLRSQYQKQYEEKVEIQATAYKEKEQALLNERLQFEKKKAQENELFKKRLESEKSKIQEQVEKEKEEKFLMELASLKKENEERKEENRALKAKELDLREKENKLKEEKEEMELTIKEKMLSQKTEIENTAREKERQKFELEKIQLLKQIEDNKKLAEEMKRKAEQGSMQMQGEVQEIALKELLATAYPFDKVEDVPTGIRGADLIQKVINFRQEACGVIVYESKRTKAFDIKWIDKLKQDQMRVKGDLAVLVTETMPKDMKKFDCLNGVWVCHYTEVKSLSKVLREILITTKSVKGAQENKGDKMELLYSYLTSSDFVQKVKRIIENYDAMLNQLISEKKSMMRIWSEREKQIWVVQENINALFGDIKGIAGNSLSTSEILEIKEPEFE